MWITRAAIIVAALALAGGAKPAAAITFVATGNADVAGFITIADSAFDGSDEQDISNTQITAAELSITVNNSTTTFGFADVTGSGETTFIDDNSSLTLDVGSGSIFARGDLFVFFIGDDIIPSNDGDADIEFAQTGQTSTRLPVLWVAETAVIPAPATLPLLLTALAGLAFARRRHAHEPSEAAGP